MGEGWGEGRKSIDLIPLRNWKDCLDRDWDWPHAIGRDEKGPLIWQTAKAYDDWKTIMRDLAIIKIGLRTQFVFTSDNNAPRPEQRHWLSYPVTNHSVKPWGNNARLPNSLRFKVRPDEGNPKKLRGVMYHVPCLPPPDFKPDLAAIEQTSQAVHDLLDELCRAKDRTYSMIADTARRKKLQPELDKVALERIGE
jgi:CRISPR-associated protein Cmr1